MRSEKFTKRVAPKSHYLLPRERQAIIDYRLQHLDEGYRRLAYMMLDADIVAVSPSSIYRVLKEAGLLKSPWPKHVAAKGKGFAQPTRPHQHWHLDISYINFKGTFVFLVVLIDGYSRYIVHAELKLSVEALDVEIMLERAREKFPCLRLSAQASRQAGAQPVLITDNGPQFIAREFASYLDSVDITHRRTRFYYPQSNGKVERFMKTCKTESVRKKTALDFDELQRQIADYIEFYNTKRLHSSLGYITPLDVLLGKSVEIVNERKRKLELAQRRRTETWQNQTVDASDVLASAVLAAQIRSEEQNPDRMLFPTFKNTIAEKHSPAGLVLILSAAENTLPRDSRSKTRSRLPEAYGG